MRPDTYLAWSVRHPLAAAELNAMLLPVVSARGDAGSEARVQSEIRLEAAGKGVKLWRNNSGAMTDDTGRLIRFGLGHESKALSDRLKSSDLVGWRKTLVTPSMVGTTVAVTVCRECKPPGWRLTPGDKRGQAQAAWLALVAADGGDAAFATGTGTL